MTYISIIYLDSFLKYQKPKQYTETLRSYLQNYFKECISEISGFCKLIFFSLMNMDVISTEKHNWYEHITLGVINGTIILIPLILLEIILFTNTPGPFQV